jgi:two-component system phosphate regulon sensor histidine kinase PhoR
MTLSDETGERGSVAESWSRVTPAQLVVAGAAMVFVVLVLAGALSPLAALAGFAVIAGIAVLGRRMRGAAEPLPAPAEGLAGPDVAASPDALIAGLPDPVVVLDENGLVVAFNPRASAVAPALRRAEPVSFALRMPAVVDAIRRAVASGEAQSAEFSERVPIDRWYGAHVMPIPRAAGAPGGSGLMLLTLHDLTPLRRSEEMRADFIANASHELRTPLASLSGFIDTLQGPAREDPAARERFLGIMKGQARRMARLIDDLLSLSRIELNEHIHPETRLDLVPIVQQVIDSLQMLAHERSVRVAVAAPSEPLIVLGDRDELVRVFENLVENALKYGASGGRIEIAMERATQPDGSAEAVISVQDYGPGIPPEHLPRLTERFYRVDVGHSRAEGGTGLGLALVKHALNRHRGRLAIASTLGAGATFTARLPLAEP